MNLFKKWPVYGLGVLVASCNSPLLNHLDAGSGDLQRDRSEASQAIPCPLRFSRHGLCAQLLWDRTPTDQDEATFSLRFWNETEATSHGPYLSPVDAITVKLWMPTMGHGSSPVTLLPALDSGHQAIAGVYLGSSVYFIMPGAWEVKVQLRSAAGEIEEAKINVQI